MAYGVFGSFLTQDVDKLIAQPDHTPPTSPLDDFGLWGEEMPHEFGEAMRGEFILSSEWTFLNHGAFGAPFKRAHKAADDWRQVCERQPLRFLDRQLFPLLVDSIAQLATVLGVDKSDLVLLSNASEALNVVLRFLLVDAVLGAVATPPEVLKTRRCVTVVHFSTVYGATKKVLAHLSGLYPHIKPIEVPLHFPLMGPSDVFKRFVSHLDSLEERVDVAIFDHVTSSTALLMPVPQLVNECRRRGIVVLVDGAHSLAFVPDINVSDIGADFFFGNCHKWFCNPRGCGYLWVSPRKCGEVAGEAFQASPYLGRVWRNSISPLLCSHGGLSGFTSKFIWSGNRDYSSLLSIPATRQCWRLIGGMPKAAVYCRDLCHWAVLMLSTRWGTGPLVPLEFGMTLQMALVRIPDTLLPLLEARFVAMSGNGMVRDEETSMRVGQLTDLLQDFLHFNYSIEVPVKCVENRLYVRISAHVYNSTRDFERLADAIEDLQNGPRT